MPWEDALEFVQCHTLVSCQFNQICSRLKDIKLCVQIRLIFDSYPTRMRLGSSWCLQYRNKIIFLIKSCNFIIKSYCFTFYGIVLQLHELVTHGHRFHGQDVIFSACHTWTYFKWQVSGNALLPDASKCYFWLAIRAWHEAEWCHILTMLDCPCKHLADQ